jgi:hypothetical protein
MKCHICHKTLQFQKDDPYIQPGEPSVWECPDMHATIQLNRFDDSIIEAYRIYWDGDQNAQERFRLTGQRATTMWLRGNQTVLYKIDTWIVPDTTVWTRGNQYAKFPKWKLILTLDHYFDLQVIDGQIQADNLIPRLLRLKVFV